jgi:iron complex transport system ATP-binding protein
MKSKDPNLTRILITHRLDEIPESFQKLLLLKEGKILAFGDKKKVLTSENLSNLYDLPLALQEQNGQYSVSVSK